MSKIRPFGPQIEANEPAEHSSTPIDVRAAIFGDKLFRLAMRLGSAIGILASWLFHELRATAIATWQQLVRLALLLQANFQLWQVHRLLQQEKLSRGEELLRTGNGDLELKREVQEIDREIKGEKVGWFRHWQLARKRRSLVIAIADRQHSASISSGTQAVGLAAQLAQAISSEAARRRAIVPETTSDLVRIAAGVGLFVLAPLIFTLRLYPSAPFSRSSAEVWTAPSEITEDQIRTIDAKYAELQQRLATCQEQLAHAEATFQPTSKELAEAKHRLENAMAMIRDFEATRFVMEVAACRKIQQELLDAESEYKSLVRTYLPTSSEALKQERLIEDLRTEHKRHSYLARYVAANGALDPASPEIWLRFAEHAASESTLDRERVSKSAAMQEIASLWVRLGQLPEASRVLSSHNLATDSTYAEMTDVLSEWGDIPAALQVAELIVDHPDDKAKALIKVAHRAAEKGDRTRARQVLSQIQGTVNQSESWSLRVDYGKSLAKTKALDEARGMLLNAVQTANSDQSRNALSVTYDLVSIAEAQAECGFFEDAEQTIANASARPGAGAATSSKCKSALAELSVRRCEGEGLSMELALKAIDENLTHYDCVRARCRIAMVAAKQGRKDEARRILDAALGTSKSDRFKYERTIAEMTSFTEHLRKERREAIQRMDSAYSREVREIATALAELGHVEEAIKLVGSIPGSDYKTACYKSEALAAIAAIVATKNDHRLALSLLDKAARTPGIKLTNFSWEPRKAVALKQLALGAEDSAMETLNLIEYRGDQLDVLSAFSETYSSTRKFNSIRDLLNSNSHFSLETSAIALGSARGLMGK